MTATPVPLPCAVLFTLLAALPSIASPYPQEDGAVPRGPIEAAALRAHVQVLASDEFGGRALGTEGIERAAHYLAAQFEAMGLEPAGDADSFLQAVTLQQERYEALPELSIKNSEGEARALVYGADFRLARAGAGGTFGLLILREGDPIPKTPDPHLALCFPDHSRGKASRWLRDAGHSSGTGFGAIVTFLRRPGEATTKLPRPSRMVLKKESAAPPAAPWLELSPDLREMLTGAALHQLVVAPHLAPPNVVSYNVIARLPGRGSKARPGLADEAVVVSAHYDHLGILDPSRIPEDAGPDFDTVFNGADDDASGVATVLEIAAHLAAEGSQAREVIFLLATAEEVGVVGTSHYLEHPSTPLERTVVNLNFEMLGRPDELAGGKGRLWLTGAQRTNLMEAYLERGFQIVADPHPEQNFFQRSDNIVFCYRGIVGQTFSTYNLHGDYHQRTDELQTLDFEHMQACARAGLRAVKLVADGSIDPQWLEGGQPKRR